MKGAFLKLMLTHLGVVIATEQELRPAESALTLKCGFWLCSVLSSVHRYRDTAQRQTNTFSIELAGHIAEALFSFEVASESKVSVHNQLCIPAAIMWLTCGSVDFSEYSKACFFLMQILFLLLYLSLKYRKLQRLLGWHS